MHNVRIERAWLDVWNGVSNVYSDIFHYLESKSVLDPNSDIDIWCLHHVYMPLVNKDLETFVAQWNNHGLRTENYKSPLNIFVKGILTKGQVDEPLNLLNATESTDSPENPTNIPDEITVPSFHQPISDASLAELNDIYGEAEDFENNYALDFYVNVRNYVTGHITANE